MYELAADCSVGSAGSAILMTLSRYDMYIYICIYIFINIHIYIFINIYIDSIE
jgi:hypothetical protein